MKKRTIWFSILGVLLVVLVVMSGLRVMPVAVVLGPCLKDWSNSVSYRPRASPLASLDFPVGEGEVRLCYGRPSAKGRTIFGKLVPYNELWRTGANEPTRLFTDRPLSIAGVSVAPGRYSIYTVPGPDSWEVVVNRSTSQWGNDFSAGVLAQEVGRGRVPSGRTEAPVEQLTIRVGGAASDSVSLIVEWENTRIEVPVVGK
jgi:Protein of unknown function (DUF2911)